MSTPDQNALEEDLDILLGELCVQMGFCNQLCGEDLLQGRDKLTSYEFARQVLFAEKIDPDNSKWITQLSARFKDRYGDAVSVTTFRPESNPA